MKAAWKSRLVLAWLLGLAAGGVSGATIDVLWYTYAHPQSMYVQTIQKLAEVVHTLPKSSGLRWRLTFFRPGSAAPAFEKYNVLVIHSAEPGFTGQHHPSLGGPDPKQPNVTPDYTGILRNKRAIEAARGERTFITGSDADVHTVYGDSGHAPPDPSGKKRRVTCKSPISDACWDGALGHLVNAINWAASGHGLGIVSLVAGEHPRGQWWLDRNSFLRDELKGFVVIWGAGTTRENNPAVPVPAQNYPLNSGLTTKGLGNWNNSFHGGISSAIPGYVPIVNSTIYPNVAVAIATARFANAGTNGPRSPAEPGDRQR